MSSSTWLCPGSPRANTNVMTPSSLSRPAAVTAPAPLLQVSSPSVMKIMYFFLQGQLVSLAAARLFQPVPAVQVPREHPEYHLRKPSIELPIGVEPSATSGRTSGFLSSSAYRPVLMVPVGVLLKYRAIL